MSDMRVLTFRCDDAAGFELRVLQASDGDFHVSVVPNVADLEKEGRDAESYMACFGASVRIRMPMIGGGMHEKLYHALLRLFLTPTFNLVEVEASAIADAMYEARGNRSKAAELLGPQPICNANENAPQEGHLTEAKPC